jgi:hypothetical protein
MHTEETDGSSAIEDMAAAAGEIGRDRIGTPITRRQFGSPMELGAFHSKLRLWDDQTER